VYVHFVRVRTPLNTLPHNHQLHIEMECIGILPAPEDVIQPSTFIWNPGEKYRRTGTVIFLFWTNGRGGTTCDDRAMLSTESSLSMFSNVGGAIQRHSHRNRTVRALQNTIPGQGTLLPVLTE
jgi:hypothetical protein